MSPEENLNTADPWKILVVDDNDDDLFLIRDLLEEEWPGGHPPAVTTAGTFEEGLRLASNDAFDLCLFDYQLGRYDGLDLLATVRDQGVATPVILLTGQGDEEVAVAAMKAGVADYIPKRRLTPELLQHAVRYVIEMNRAEALRRRAESALKESEERYRELVNNIPALICELKPDGIILFVNPAVMELSGYSEDELVGRNWWELFQVDPATRQATGALSCKNNPELTKRCELRIKVKDGSIKVLNWNVTCRLDHDGALREMVCVGVDISELVQLREELKELAITDDLTGLLNRRGFFTLGEHQLRLAVRQRKDLFLLYADLDNMKTINDTLGHEQGDEALRVTASLLREAFRESDVIGRLGGDEFAVLVAGAPGHDGDQIKERLADKLGSYNLHSNLPLAISIGVANLPAGGKLSLDLFVKQADALMYEEKVRRRAGRERA